MMNFARMKVPHLVLWFGFAGLVIASAAAVNFVLGVDQDLLNLGRESNLPTWFSSIQLFTIGLVLATIVVREVEPPHPKTWSLALVPFLFFLLSLDEIAMLHERAENLGGAGTGPGVYLGTGMTLAGLGLIGLLSVVSFWPYVRDRRSALILFGVGIGLFVFAAGVLEIAAGLVGEASLAYRGLGFAEEYGEMLAATLILWGSLIVVQGEGVRLELGRPRNLATRHDADGTDKPSLGSG